MPDATVPSPDHCRPCRAWISTVPLLFAAVAGAARSQQLAFRELQQSTFVDGDLAFDSSRNRLVAVNAGRTLEWDGASWHARPTAVRPANRSGLRLTYDSARRCVVMFGGVVGDHATDELWEYDGFDWRLRVVAAGPVARNRPALAYDSARGRVVVYGGTSDQGNPLSDTWEWDGVAWQSLPVAGPGARSEAAMAFHPASARTILFGGADFVGPRSDTWAWDGTAWTPLATATVPPRRAGHAMTLDPVRGCLMMFGSADAQHWEWWGTDWVAGASGPPMRRGHAMAADGNGLVLVFGGRTEPIGNYQTTVLGDLWAWTGSQWLQLRTTGPQPRSGAALDYDVGRDRLVFVGGGNNLTSPTHVWEWDGVNWSETVPPSEPPYLQLTRYCHDRGRGVGVLFGGLNGFPFAYDGTHEWNGSTWTQLLPAVSPPPRFEHALVYDQARSVVLLFGGRDLFTTYGDTWSWNGTAWTLLATGGPSARSATALAYDAQRARVVMFGGGRFTGANPVVATDETWEWDGASWIRRLPPSAPAARSYHALAFDRARNVTVLAGGWNGGVQLPEVWEWDGVSWTGGARMLPAAVDCQLVFHDRLRRLLLLVPVNTGTALGANDLWLGSPQAAQATNDGAGCGPQLELRAFGPPVLGRPAFALDLRSAPFTVALVGVGEALGNQPLGSGCTLYLQSPVLSVPVTIGADGFGSLQIPVPANPALVGQTVVFQAGSPRVAAPLGFALSPYVLLRLGD